MESKDRSPEVLTVSKLTRRIQSVLEGNFGTVWVEGEISNFRAPVSGHLYMALKDEMSQIKAVMFRSQARYLKFRPRDGMMVIARGKIGVYAPRGEYQIILDYLEPLGVGAMSLAFEQLKQKLSAMGVFAQEKKKPLPFLPQRVAVITSPTGAAIRDFLKVINRRFANLEITVVPVRVQGDEAAQDIIRAIDMVNRLLDVDVIVLTRGGGSIEDLWPFNNEELAFAIRRSKVPVVSAVGHEIDFTISDLAADFRAPTPSAAAELLVEEKEILLRRLKEIESRLVYGITRYIEATRQSLDYCTRLLRDPKRRLSDYMLRLDEYHSKLVSLMRLAVKERRSVLENETRALRLNSPEGAINASRQSLAFHADLLARSMERCLDEWRLPVRLLAKRIEDLGPVSAFNRGYSVVQKLPERKRIRDSSSVGRGDLLEVILQRGKLNCAVKEVVYDEENM